MLIKVYYERHPATYAEVVAFFDSEEVYNAVLPALEKNAKDNGFDIVTESILECTDLDTLDNITKGY